AKGLLERAIREQPTETQYYGMLAQVYDELGDQDKALEMYKLALVQDPDDSMTRISLAQYYYDLGKQEEAFEQLREAFADPDLDVDPKMQLLLGFYQMTQDAGAPPSARIVEESHALIAVLKKAHPQSGKPFSIEGDFLLREGRHAEAREAFRQALVFEQDKYPIWSALLQLDMQLADYAATHADAEQAIELFPTQPEFHLYNGIALSQLKKHQEAIEALLTGRDLVVDNEPLLAQFWSSLGDAYNSAEQFQDSDRAYERALALNANDISVLNNYAYYLSERGEHLDKAETMSRRTVDMAPGVSTYLDTYAWVLYKQGKYADARIWQEKALAAGPPEGVLLEHYGDILFKLGDAQGAVEQWKKAKAAGDASDLIDRKVGEGRLVE
ncbi:MAG TPA: tetratricopeptide repeat protein, partial [Flavobacteriales bacterium]